MTSRAVLTLLACALAAPLQAAENPAESAISADSQGFGDAQFARMMAASKDPQTRVPQLAALYDSLPKKSAESNTYKPAHPELVEGARPAGAPAGLPLAAFRLTSTYGPRLHPVLGIMRNHKGLDLAAPEGTPIRATADGTVARAAWAGGYGLMVELSHGNRTETRYGHMSRLAVLPGQRVAQGEVIGYVGSTGRSTGPHVHYEILVDGRAVDPSGH